MKILTWLNKVPKGVAGIATVFLGAATYFIPFIGPIASPYICGAGAVLITGSAIDKSIRAYKGEDIFLREKNIITKMNNNKGDHYEQHD